MLPVRTAAALLAALATPALGSPYPVQHIDMQNFSYVPRPIVLAAGQPVTLLFVNNSGGGHDFTSPAFFANSTIIAGGAPGGRIALPGHSTRAITLIPQRRATYAVKCTHFLHATFGMTDTIVVR